MIRLAWRQFRAEAIVGVGLLVVAAVILAVTGPHLVDVYRASPIQVTNTDHPLQIGLMALLLVAPALIGVFFGAPLVARELESGTFRLIFTQGVTRARWLVVKLALVGLASSVIAGALSLMVAWWGNPINIENANRFSPALFGMFGIVPFAYGLFAFALGGRRLGFSFERPSPPWRRRSSATWPPAGGDLLDPLLDFAAALMKTFTLTAKSQIGFQKSPAGLQVVLQSPAIPNAWVLSTAVADKAGHAPTSRFLGKACPGILGGAPKVGLAGRGRLLGKCSSVSPQSRPNFTAWSRTSRRAATGRSSSTRRPSSSCWRLRSRHELLVGATSLDVTADT